MGYDDDDDDGRTPSNGNVQFLFHRNLITFIINILLHFGLFHETKNELRNGMAERDFAFNVGPTSDIPSFFVR